MGPDKPSSILIVPVYLFPIIHADMDGAEHLSPKELTHLTALGSKLSSTGRQSIWTSVDIKDQAYPLMRPVHHNPLSFRAQ